MTRTAAIVGAGLVGRSWTIVFARAGWQVRVYDRAEQARTDLPRAVSNALADLQAQGLLERDIESALAAISVHATLEQALDGAEYIQESGPEDLALKREIFSAIDAAADPDTIIATSSSGLKISAVAEHLPGRSRCLVAHPINPPHLVPCVELSPADWTTPAVVAKTADIMRDLGQAPVRLEREIDGFVVNRLQGALLNEALRLVEGGYVSAEGIDTAIRDGLGLRWSFMGPFETIDLNAPAGIGDYARRFGPMYAEMAVTQSATPNWTPQLIDRIEAERRAELPAAELPQRQAWRDRRLVGLVAHKKAAIGEDKK